MSALTPFHAHDLAHPLQKGITLLEASAGTGKTYALCAIYLRLILESGLTVQQILVTTFTVAATSELRGRIRTLLRDCREAFVAGHSPDPLLAAVLERWQADAATQRERLRVALLDFDEGAIFTIHGFCQRVLSDRSFESATLGDQKLVPDERELIREVAMDYWRQRFYGCDDCLSTAAHVAGLSVSQLAQLLTLRIQQPSARILPPSQPGDLDTLCAEISRAHEECRACWVAEEAELRRCLRPPHNTWAKLKHAQVDEVQEMLDAIGENFAQGSGSVAGQLALTFFALSAVAKSTRVRQAPPALRFFAACEKLKAGGERFATTACLEFLHWAPPNLAAQKQRAGVQSFSDQLSRLQASLQGPGGDGMVEAVRARYHAALVDEFQDTDPVQEEIFARLFGGGDGWLFLIGDPKQAIYGFRGADVFTYLRAARRVGEGRAHTLGTNFRSSAELVRGINALFQHGPRPFVLEALDFQPVTSSGRREADRFHGDTYSAPLRLWEWEGAGDEAIDTVRAEIIQATAAEIARLLTGTARLGERPVKPPHIAVLTLRNEDALAVQAALAGFGVPSVLLEVESVFRSREAADLLALLSSIVRPADEGLLRGALLTEALGLGFAEVQALATDGAGWEHWVALFQGWHGTWLARGFMPMFQRMLREAAVPGRLLAQAQGERRLTNLLHLAELLQTATLGEQLGPRGLVKWLAREIAHPSQELAAHEVRLERDDEAVRVVTVHKSKGLEYDIVFCPLLIRHPAGREKNVRLHDPATGELILDLGSPDRDHHRQLAEVELLADDVRLLYVALTRARYRCDFVWGLYKEADVSALGSLLYPPDRGAGSSLPLVSKRLLNLPEAERRAGLEALGRAAGGALVVHPLPSPEAPRYRPHTGASVPLEARTFRGRIVRDYGVSSFTSLSEAHHPELPDYDFPRPETLSTEPETRPEGMHAFPGGTRTGIFMHEIFEELDFSQPASVEELVRQKLAAYSYPVAAWSEAVTACVRRTVQLPLADGFCLQQITPAAQRAELEFFLPARQLEAGPLHTILAQEDLRLDFAPRQGWLKGFIDLLVEHDGRYYIFDWKTNRLGSRTADYGPAPLAQAMASHRYGLQLHLYTLAVHRYLRQRLPDYRYEQHFGAAYYLFVRGIDPQQPQLGVVRRRPAARTIEALEKWLGNEQPELF